MCVKWMRSSSLFLNQSFDTYHGIYSVSRVFLQSREQIYFLDKNVFHLSFFTNTYLLMDFLWFRWIELTFLKVFNFLPHKVKTQYVHFSLHANYFLDIGRFLKKLTDDQYVLFNKWRQYLPYQTYVHTTFYHGIGLSWNGMFNGSILCLIFAHTGVLFCMAVLQRYKTCKKSLHLRKVTLHRSINTVWLVQFS